MENDNLFGEIISSYSTEQAVGDGLLIELGSLGKIPVFATAACFHTAGLDDLTKREGIVTAAVNALNEHDPEDSDGMRLRVLCEEPDTIWAILDGQGLTIMLPSDY